MEDHHSKQVAFLKEQLKLSNVKKANRKYSPDLLACAALWENTSPALYRQIQEEEILTLPTRRHIRNLTSSFSVESGMSEATVQYLNVRISSLIEREKTVNLIGDEVYSSKRIEYNGGTFYGYENQTVTKTLLCFMIKSVGGKYMDMVSMSPISKLDSNVLEKQWNNVLKQLTSVGFIVVCDTLDGHSSNRKFYKDNLCKGDLKISIKHPFLENSDIFLLFDSVHIFKCIYNNFINKKKFFCPEFDGEEIEPDLQHIQKMYNLEIGRPVKYCHKLSDKVLHPHPIEKTKVELADRLFHESTISGKIFSLLL